MYQLIKLFFLLFLIINPLNADITIAYDVQSKSDPKKPTKHQKVELDKIKKIALKHNIKVTFKAVPWKRSLLMVEKGLIDGVIQASYKTNRAKYANYPMKNTKVDSSKRLNDGNSYYIYRNIDSPLRWDGKKFLGKGVVAAMDKYAVVDNLKKHPNITIKTFNNNSEIIRKVASKQLDAYAGSSRVTDDLLKYYPSLAKNIVRESLPIRKKEYFLIFSKKTYDKKEKEIELIWSGLKEYNINNGLDK